ncbi:hypothetical protein NP048_05090 [Cellulomonas xiejunii]|uniref:Cobalt transporter n=1 Tax=Cellulomonas xiejunii TaxID=2968083 RepID=A0ABY5KWS2_9CELL|nr:hypothetical protein [Cellulomonas xiejunii]MCC2314485.1 hypothetical protein [Cellulomonas xiejunii]MCC2322799.1 hypothetical protein [Cellulomonas xiejunii]UUI73702.1 hypothetical protein NP048_05090 [Cellulomonas xiejunii]
MVTAGLAVVLLAVAVGAVVALLRNARPDTPVAERCVAHLDGTDWSLTPDQAQNAALAAAVATRRGMPARAVTIGIATALQESRLVNIDYGDRDSVGLYQQRPSQGWGTVEQIMDPVYSTNKFFEGLEKVPGYQDMAVTEAAQAVQRSGFPDAYAQHEVRARAWASALTGHSPAALSCALRPVEQPGGTGPVLARVTRDLGDLPVTVTLADGAGTPSTVDLVATALPIDDPTRAGWSVAQWSVAVAWEIDVDAVTVGDTTWSRAEPTWQVTGQAPLPPGQVRLTVAG